MLVGFPQRTGISMIPLCQVVACNEDCNFLLLRLENLVGRQQVLHIFGVVKYAPKDSRHLETFVHLKVFTFFQSHLVHSEFPLLALFPCADVFVAPGRYVDRRYVARRYVARRSVARQYVAILNVTRRYVSRLNVSIL
jgi:hypothetical protein